MKKIAIGIAVIGGQPSARRPSRGRHLTSAAHPTLAARSWTECTAMTSMTSDAERYTPIAEGEYLAKRRDVIMSEEDRKKHIPKYYQVRNMDKKNIIPTIDSKSNNNAPTQIENGVPYKSDICIHSTLTSSNLVGSKTSTGCLLLEWNSFMRFDAMMMKIGNGVYFPVIVNRTK